MNRQELLTGLDKIAKIGIAKAKAKGYNNPDMDLLAIYYSDGSFEVNFEDQNNDSTYFMEVSLDEVEQDLETILAEQKRLEEERIAKALEAQRHCQAILDKANEEKEYKQYLKLKAKFEK